MNWWTEEITNPKAYEKALTEATTPLSIDRDKQEGEFNGASNTRPEPYHTTLEKCPCGAHGKPEHPCKHMYRLAMELGLMPGSFKTDKAQIRISAYQRKSGFTLDEFVARIESVSEEAQLALRAYLRKSTCKPIVYKSLKRDLPLFAELVKAGIMTACDEPGRFALSEDALDECHRANTYLMYKYECVNTQYDKTMPPDCPYGAKHVEQIDPETGEITYMLMFKNPEIDALLTKYECNRLNPPVRLTLRDDGGYDYYCEVE